MRAILVPLALLLGCGRTGLERLPPPPVPVPPEITKTWLAVGGNGSPDLMLLIDRSGSMGSNASTQSPCPPTLGGCGIGAPCPAGCPTLLSELQSAVAGVLGQYGGGLRTGVAVFPGDQACAPTGAPEVLLHLPDRPVEDAAELQAHSARAAAVINSVTPMGGTPTAASLRFLSSLDELGDATHRRYVLLLTGGAPNCNAQNPYTCADPVGCACTIAECSVASGQCSTGCLDASPAVDAVKALAKADVTTVVVGLGPGALTSGATDTLDRMAIAGADPVFAAFPSCPSGQDSECGNGDTCDTASQLCRRRYFYASNGSELKQLLDGLLAPPPAGPDPCVYRLTPPPADPSALSVLVDGAVQPPCSGGLDCQSWTYADGEVTFEGATCGKLEAATPQAPVKVEVRYPVP